MWACSYDLTGLLEEPEAVDIVDGQIMVGTDLVPGRTGLHWLGDGRDWRVVIVATDEEALSLVQQGVEAQRKLLRASLVDGQ